MSRGALVFKPHPLKYYATSPVPPNDQSPNSEATSGSDFARASLAAGLFFADSRCGSVRSAGSSCTSRSGGRCFDRGTGGSKNGGRAIGTKDLPRVCPEEQRKKHYLKSWHEQWQLLKWSHCLRRSSLKLPPSCLQNRPYFSVCCYDRLKKTN
jgi:hypothetical protein